MSSVIKLIICIIASFAAGGIGSLFTFKAIPTWYAGLKKPPYTPPNWVFGPIWTTLYILMGISVFLVWQKGLATNGAMLAFILFWIQLAFNAVWSVIFFGMRSKGGRSHNNYCTVAPYFGDDNYFFPGFGMGRRTSNPLHRVGQHRLIPEHWCLATKQACQKMTIN
jgi:hypothetical protein